MDPASKPLHIGIVGCSAEGAALCYRTICAEGSTLLGPYGHPEVSIHTPSLARYVAFQNQGDLDGIADLMLISAQKLAAAGADFLICPDNTIHQAVDRMISRSPLPWLHIAEVAAAAAVDRGFRRIGILGTRWLINSSVYPDALAAHGLDFVLPGGDETMQIGRIIMEELVEGIFKPESVAIFQAVIASLKSRGCDSVVLGCTEIPLIIGDENSPLPTLDSARLLARAPLRRATGNDFLLR